MEGDIALASLPQADGLIKPRPAVLLRQMPPFGDWLVAAAGEVALRRRGAGSEAPLRGKVRSQVELGNEVKAL